MSLPHRPPHEQSNRNYPSGPRADHRSASTPYPPPGRRSGPPPLPTGRDPYSYDRREDEYSREEWNKRDRERGWQREYSRREDESRAWEAYERNRSWAGRSREEESYYRRGQDRVWEPRREPRSPQRYSDSYYSEASRRRRSASPPYRASSPTSPGKNGAQNPPNAPTTHASFKEENLSDGYRPFVPEKDPRPDSISGAQTKDELSRNVPLVKREDGQTPPNLLSVPAISSKSASTTESSIKQEHVRPPLIEGGVTLKDPNARDKGKARATTHEHGDHDVKMEDAAPSPVHIPSGPRALTGTSAPPRAPPPGPRQQSSATQLSVVSSPLSQAAHTPPQRGYQSPVTPLHSQSNPPHRSGAGGRRDPPTAPQGDRLLSKVDSQGSSKGAGHGSQKGSAPDMAKTTSKEQEQEQSSSKKEKRLPSNDEERLEMSRKWSAKLIAEHAQLARATRRAIHELDIATIDLHAAEQRRQIADMQLEHAKAGQLGIDYVQV